MSAPTDCRGADQFQPSHRDGYGDHLASALDRARKGWALNAAEASALVAEVERLRAVDELLAAVVRALDPERRHE